LEGSAKPRVCRRLGASDLRGKMWDSRNPGETIDPVGRDQLTPLLPQLPSPYHSAVLQRLIQHIRALKLLRPGDRVGVAVSGGADSVALLRLLLEARQELGLVLSVVHFNHKLRGAESDGDERFVAELAKQHGLELHTASADTKAYAAEHGLGLEAAARKLRHQYFNSLLAYANTFDRVLTAHTMEDQAETVLLRLIRGSGISGLAGIKPMLKVEGDAGDMGSCIVRPLLRTRRTELREYLQQLKQSWREDASNQDVGFARNRVRHVLMPLLQKGFNPNIVEVLADTAEVAREEDNYLQDQVQYGRAVRPGTWPDDSHTTFYTPKSPGSESPSSTPSELNNPADVRCVPMLSVDALRRLPLALRRRAVRAGNTVLGGVPCLDLLHVDRVLALAESLAGTRCELPGGWSARRTSDFIILEPALNFAGPPSGHYALPLPIPGEADLSRWGHPLLRASLVNGSAEISRYNPDQLLDVSLLAPVLTVRTWRAGDRFWPAHSKSPKKVKELLQRHRILQPRKAQWPVVVSGEEIVWIPGFPVSARHRARNDTARAVLLEEVIVGE